MLFDLHTLSPRFEARFTYFGSGERVALLAVTLEILGKLVSLFIIVRTLTVAV